MLYVAALTSAPEKGAQLADQPSLEVARQAEN